MIRASVVFPEPGGPQKMREGSGRAERTEERNFPSPSSSSCPTKSERRAGRIRSARGAIITFSFSPDIVPDHNGEGIDLTGYRGVRRMGRKQKGRGGEPRPSGTLSDGRLPYQPPRAVAEQSDQATSEQRYRERGHVGRQGGFEKVHDPVRFHKVLITSDKVFGGFPAADECVINYVYKRG